MREKIEKFITGYLERKFVPVLKSGSGFMLLSSPDYPQEKGCARFFPFGYDDHLSIWPRWKLMHAVVNLWVASDHGRRHTHKGWSISIVLSGNAIEDRSYMKQELRPGSIVIRGPCVLHRFLVPKGKVAWTLFIYGRRKHEQIWV